MKNLLLTAGFLAAVVSVRADTIAAWTFELNTPADATDSTTIGPILADTGVGTASGLHAGAATDWTTPSGNGSANSLAANTWAVGDYYQFQISTIGFTDVSI
jgi:hypothetical protein